MAEQNKTAVISLYEKIQLAKSDRQLMKLIALAIEDAYKRGFNRGERETTEFYEENNQGLYAENAVLAKALKQVNILHIEKKHNEAARLTNKTLTNLSETTQATQRVVSAAEAFVNRVEDSEGLSLIRAVEALQKVRGVV